MCKIANARQMLEFGIARKIDRGVVDPVEVSGDDATIWSENIPWFPGRSESRNVDIWKMSADETKNSISRQLRRIEIKLR